MRKNTHKEKILGVLTKEHLLSISDIQERLGASDFSTIFRNIEKLAVGGLVRKVVVSKDLVLYELADHEAHDHFICTDCGIIESVHLPKTALAGKTVVDVTIRGFCTKCSK